MAFGIDVRSEVLRRALESLDPGIRTQGFAGFFGLPVAHQPFASDVVENSLPVLLRPSFLTCAAVPSEAAAERARVAALPAAERIDTAEAVLRAMSLTTDLAPLVLLAGHGAMVVSNPHASALHCAACGGYQGDVSARLLATLLNDAEVREVRSLRPVASPSRRTCSSSARCTTRQPMR